VKNKGPFRSAERAAPVLILLVKEIQFSDAVSTKDDKHSGVIITTVKIRSGKFLLKI